MRILAAALIALLFLVGVALLTEAPARLSSDEQALLRLSWRLPAGEGEDCRRPTPEELAELPVHMRNPDACVGGEHPGYRLTVSVDGTELVNDTVFPAGSRHDRPMFVFDDVPLEPGDRTISVVFQRNVAATVDDGTGTVPRRLAWERQLDVAPREVVILAYEPEWGELRSLRSPR